MNIDQVTSLVQMKHEISCIMWISIWTKTKTTGKPSLTTVVPYQRAGKLIIVDDQYHVDLHPPVDLHFYHCFPHRPTVEASKHWEEHPTTPTTVEASKPEQHPTTASQPKRHWRESKTGLKIPQPLLCCQVAVNYYKSYRTLVTMYRLYYSFLLLLSFALYKDLFPSVMLVWCHFLVSNPNFHWQIHALFYFSSDFRFPNSGCSANGGLNGTCYSETECRKRQGLVAGWWLTLYPSRYNVVDVKIFWFPTVSWTYLKVAVLEVLGCAVFSTLPVARWPSNFEHWTIIQSLIILHVAIGCLLLQSRCLATFTNWVAFQIIAENSTYLTTDLSSSNCQYTICRLVS